MNWIIILAIIMLICIVLNKIISKNRNEQLAVELEPKERTETIYPIMQTKKNL